MYRIRYRTWSQSHCSRTAVNRLPVLFPVLKKSYFYQWLRMRRALTCSVSVKYVPTSCHKMTGWYFHCEKRFYSNFCFTCSNSISSMTDKNSAMVHSSCIFLSSCSHVNSVARGSSFQRKCSYRLFVSPSRIVLWSLNFDLFMTAISSCVFNSFVIKAINVLVFIDSKHFFVHSIECL